MKYDMMKWTRRDLLRSAAATTAMAAVPVPAQRIAVDSGMPFDVDEAPISVNVFCGLTSRIDLARHGDEWRDGDSVVSLKDEGATRSIVLSAPSVHPTHVRLRWRGTLPPRANILGDAWERSYGELAWENCRPERVLPWYVAIATEKSTYAYGVLCGASAFAFWQVDTEGLTLWLDVRNGGEGVELGGRALRVASFTSFRGDVESAHSTLVGFCKRLSPQPRRMAGPLIGTNDWYYAYGHNTAAGIERDADWIAALMPPHAPRPFTIVDDGWTDRKAFPDMHALARSIRGRGVRPGIWVRPLQAHDGAPENLLLPDARYGARQKRAAERAFDPTHPEALAFVSAKVEEAIAWEYELVKHDFSTYELFGQWGNEMGASPTLPGWHFYDRTLTNAEVVARLYRTIRKAAGDNTCVIGCNTVGHLAAGIFEANRTGDDVSGKQWERTRRMGVNTLAFRLPQNKTFFVQDADCVALTHAVNWRETRQWLDVVARSGSALIFSPEPGVVDDEKRSAIRDALQASLVALAAEPQDWMQNSTPEHWRFSVAESHEVRYKWSGPEGASPFPLE